MNEQTRPTDVNELFDWLRNKLPKPPSQTMACPYQNHRGERMYTLDNTSRRQLALCLKFAAAKQRLWREDFLSVAGLHHVAQDGSVQEIEAWLVKRTIFEEPMFAYEILSLLMNESFKAAFTSAEAENEKVAKAARDFLTVERSTRINPSAMTFSYYLDTLLPAGFSAVAGMIRVVRMKQDTPNFEFTRKVMLNSISRIEEMANLPSTAFQALQASVSARPGDFPRASMYDPSRWICLDWSGDCPSIDFSPAIVDWVVDYGWDMAPKDREFSSYCPALKIKHKRISLVAESVVWMLEIMKKFWHEDWPDTQQHADAVYAFHDSVLTDFADIEIVATLSSMLGDE